MHNVPVLLSLISPRLLPPGWDTLKEPYSISAMINSQAQGGSAGLRLILPPWMQKVMKGNKRFWVYTPEEIESHLEGKRMAVEKADSAREYRQRERDEMRARMVGGGMATVAREHDDLESGSPAEGRSQHEGKDVAAVYAPRTLSK
jgi:AGZA family xanthine/uracil permease-like MFS transporter